MLCIMPSPIRGKQKKLKIKNKQIGKLLAKFVTEENYGTENNQRNQ